jgi:hypothetical protein
MKKIACCLTLFFHCGLVSASCGEPRDVVIQKAVQTFYDKCVQTGCFSGSTLHQNHIDFMRLAETVGDGFAALQLIEFLEKQHDDNCAVLLSAINELCYLKLVHFISLFECHGHDALVIEKLHYLANKEVALDGVKQKPFSTSLSKICLTIAVINAKKLKHEQKKEFLALALDKIENDMLKINRGLGVGSVREDEIRELCAALEVYAVRVTVAGVNWLKISVLVTLAIVIIYFFAPMIVDKLVAFFGEHVIRPIIGNSTRDIQRSIQILRVDAHAQIAQVLINIAHRFTPLIRNRIFANNGRYQAPEARGEQPPDWLEDGMPERQRQIF